MKTFSHGSNVNFHESTQEMTPDRLERIFHRWLEETNGLTMGTIHLEKEELRQYGRAIAVSLDGEQITITFIPIDETEQQTIHHSLEDLAISHEAVFNIVDEAKGEVRCRVLYLTFDAIDDELTYYFVDETASEPLACVAEFWQQVSEVGRDVDFTLSGCSANQFKPKDCSGKCDGE